MHCVNLSLHVTHDPARLLSAFTGSFVLKLTLRGSSLPPRPPDSSENGLQWRPTLAVSRYWNPNPEFHHGCPQLEPACQHIHLAVLLALMSLPLRNLRELK